MIEAFHPSFSELVAPDAEVEVLARGPEFLEGPIWLADEQALLVNDINGDTCYRWTDDGGLVPHRSPTGMANGMTLDHEGRVIVCEHATSRVRRIEADGVVVLCDRFGGKGLNSPNDVVVHSSGWIYFTDPPYGRQAEHGVEREQELGFQGVFRHDGVPGSEPELLDASLHRPNGLAFSLDESILYVADTRVMKIWCFAVGSDGRLGPPRHFATLGDGVYVQSAGFPDGLKLDERGNVWVTGPLGLWAFSPQGEPLGRIVVAPRAPCNFTWGGPDGLDVFCAAYDHLSRVRVRVRRAP